MDVNISKTGNINLSFSDTDENIKYTVPRNKKLVVSDDGTMKVIDKRCMACTNGTYLSLKSGKTVYIAKIAWDIEFLTNSETECKIPCVWIYDASAKTFLSEKPKSLSITPKKWTQIKMIDPSDESIISIEKLL